MKKNYKYVFVIKNYGKIIKKFKIITKWKLKYKTL